MAIARLSGQDAKGTSTTTSVSATYASTATSGNVLIATVYSNTTTGTQSITGWTLVQEKLATTARCISVFTKVSDGTETTITANATGASVMRIHIYEYSGLTTTTNGVNTSDSGGASVTSLLSGSITTTNANDLIFCVFGFNGNTPGAASFDSGFTKLQEDTAIRMVDGQLIPLATGTYSTTYTWSTSTIAGSIIVAFIGSSTSTGGTGLLMGV
jgi:hypothetical protein